MSVRHEIALIASNDSKTASYVSPDGARFSISLSDGLIIPKDAYSCDIRVDAATVWNTVPNIIAGQNDKFKITHMTVDYIVTIPQGLYGLSELEETIQAELTNQGVPVLFHFLADTPTQKVRLQLETKIQVDFTYPNTCRNLLGFNSQLIPAGGETTATEYTLADNIASFNNIEYFLITCTLVDDGIRINGNFNSVIAQIPITSGVGEQVQYDPQHPAVSPSNNLIGSKITKIDFALFDNNFNYMDTGEIWSVRMTIGYSHFETDRKKIDKL
jgi:hypothetical protein